MRWSWLIAKPHWSGGYLWRRTRLELWQRRHPDAPWLAPAAVDFLDRWLRPTDHVVELGAGRSTPWLASRVGRITSLEHDPVWLERVAAELSARGLANATLIETTETSADDYLAPLRGQVSDGVDLILVDGRHRDASAAWALDRVKPGGLLVIDDAERYLPSAAIGPEAIGPTATPASPLWAEVGERLRPWRSVWFDSGVGSTLALWPPPQLVSVPGRKLKVES